jgi:hypothetical protein
MAGTDRYLLHHRRQILFEKSKDANIIHEALVSLEAVPLEFNRPHWAVNWLSSPVSEIPQSPRFRYSQSVEMSFSRANERTDHSNRDSGKV